MGGTGTRQFNFFKNRHYQVFSLFLLNVHMCNTLHKIHKLYDFHKQNTSKVLQVHFYSLNNNGRFLTTVFPLNKKGIFHVHDILNNHESTLPQNIALLQST